MKLKDRYTLQEISEIKDTVSLLDSVLKILTAEEIDNYSLQIIQFLNVEENLTFHTKVIVLTLLKTLSHLSDSQKYLFEIQKQLPHKKNQDLYYSVPFLPELVAKKNVYDWYQKEAEEVLHFKISKGNYAPLRLLILFYESLAFQFSVNKKERKKYLKLMETVFKKIVQYFKSLNKAYGENDKNHKWYSLENTGAYRDVAKLWKNVVDITTVRHGPHLPKGFTRPLEKLPMEWNGLLKIKSPKKLSMINVIYPLQCLSSQCREIRTYSSFLLHLIAEQRPEFLNSFTHTQVDKHFLSRLKVAHSLEKSYPVLPSGVPDKFQLEMFLVLIEQAINSLAEKYQMVLDGDGDLTEKFSNFSVHADVKREIDLDDFSPEEEEEKEVDERTTEVRETPTEDKSEESEEPEEQQPILKRRESEFETITDDLEFGMGIESMPYIFPFYYEKNQSEIPLEHLPNIKWNSMNWSDMRAEDLHVFNATSQLFVKKLEPVHMYRYDQIYTLQKVGQIHPIQNFRGFIVKESSGETTYYYVAMKSKARGSERKYTLVPLEMSEKYMKNLDKAYFFILPAPYHQHLLAFPRSIG